VALIVILAGVYIANASTTSALGRLFKKQDAPAGKL
jgi:hypothetical protein